MAGQSPDDPDPHALSGVDQVPVRRSLYPVMPVRSRRTGGWACAARPPGEQRRRLHQELPPPLPGLWAGQSGFVPRPRRPLSSAGRAQRASAARLPAGRGAASTNPARAAAFNAALSPPSHAAVALLRPASPASRATTAWIVAHPDANVHLPRHSHVAFGRSQPSSCVAAGVLRPRHGKRRDGSPPTRRRGIDFRSLREGPEPPQPAIAALFSGSLVPAPVIPEQCPQRSSGQRIGIVRPQCFWKVPANRECSAIHARHGERHFRNRR